MMAGIWRRLSSQRSVMARLMYVSATYVKFIIIESMYYGTK